MANIVSLALSSVKQGIIIEEGYYIAVRFSKWYHSNNKYFSHFISPVFLYVDLVLPDVIGLHSWSCCTADLIVILLNCAGIIRNRCGHERRKSATRLRWSGQCRSERKIYIKNSRCLTLALVIPSGFLYNSNIGGRSRPVCLFQLWCRPCDCKCFRLLDKHSCKKSRGRSWSIPIFPFPISPNIFVICKWYMSNSKSRFSYGFPSLRQLLDYNKLQT